MNAKKITLSTISAALLCLASLSSHAATIFSQDFEAGLGANEATSGAFVQNTSGFRNKAQPMIDSVALCAQFLSMTWGGALWGKGGPPGAVQADAQAVEAASRFLVAPAAG